MAFEFAYTPSSTGTSTQVGFEGAKLRRQRALEDEARGRQNAFSEVLARSIDRNTGELNVQNAFLELGRRGMGSEAMALRDAMAGNALKQAQAIKAMGDAPHSRQVPMGDEVVTQEWNPAARSWTDVGRGRKGAQTEVKIQNFQPASEEAQKDFMKEMRESYSRLQNAPAVLQNIEDAKSLIPQAKGFMGPGGGGILESVKFLNNRLGLSINAEGVKSAEELRSRIFFQILENLKKMDAQPSQKQQEIMQDALGKLDTDPNALGAVLDAYGDTVRQKIDIHNRNATEAEKRGVRFPYSPSIPIPEALRNARATGGGQPAPAASNAAQHRIGDLIKGKDGRSYVIKRLDPSGDHDVELVR